MVNDQEFERWMQLLLDEMRGTNSRLDVLNGRTRENEKAIAVLQDRAPENPHVKRLSIGSICLAVITAIGELLHWYSR